jgi:hypothetical protein
MGAYRKKDIQATSGHESWSEPKQNSDKQEFYK